MRSILLHAAVPFIAAFVLAIAVGCATQETPTQRAERIEPLLSAAGFHMTPASTPSQQNALKTMTPLKVRYYPYKGKLHYWFADPDYCDCLFIGNQTAYDRYEKIRIQQQDVKAEERSAELNEEAAQQEQMDWTLWPGPFFY